VNTTNGKSHRGETSQQLINHLITFTILAAHFSPTVFMFPLRIEFGK